MDRRNFIGSSFGLISGGMLGSPVRAGEDEPAQMSGIEIVDAHHHMVYTPAKGDKPAFQYLLPDLVKDISESGLHVTQTVAVQNYSMYRLDGPSELKPVGETEFLNGIAAMSASGVYGPCRVAAGIVAYGSLRLGDLLNTVMDEHVRVAGTRLKGIRDSSAWDEYPVMGIPLDPARRTLFDDDSSLVGLRVLAKRGLSFDTWCFYHQIGNVSAIARRVPELTFILNHVGSPLAVGPYAGKQKEVFRDWKAAIVQAAKVPNLVVKLGGLGMRFVSSTLTDRPNPATSTELATAWTPYFETCIEAFGARRCMFESNYPADAGVGTYATLWNAFKRFASQASADEKLALFGGTAKRVYRLAS